MPGYSAYGPEGQCYRPCSLNTSLEPDVPPEACHFSQQLTSDSSSANLTSTPLDHDLTVPFPTSGTTSHLFHSPWRLRWSLFCLLLFLTLNYSKGRDKPKDSPFGDT